MENEQEPNITLQDLAAAVQIIDLASARGAIKGEEMAAVGQLRTRLSSFVEYASKQNNEGQEEVGAEEVEETEKES